MANDTAIRFGFGKNWESFVDSHFSQERVELAMQSMRDLLGVDDLAGRTFLDIGSGSGLFSLAAVGLGADRVVSFDFDADSVRTTDRLRSLANVEPARWQVLRGSVLDPDFMASLAPADIVYSWGVLHHTGDLWSAIDAAAAKVKPGGLLALSIYNKVDRRFAGSNLWLAIKRTYVHSPLPVKWLIEGAYVANFIVRHLITFRNPFRIIAAYRNERSRGMSFWHDVRDWVGGYPYEVATAGEMFCYLHQKQGLQLENMTTTHSVGCNEFVFSRPMGAREEK